MRLCEYCQTERPEESFDVCRVVAGKVYRRRRCRACKQAVAARRRDALKRRLLDYKALLRCATCRFADPRALDFHHGDGRHKEFNVSDMLRRGFSWEALQREIEKCSVLCANCHLIAHHDARVAAAGASGSASPAEDQASAARPAGGRKVCGYCLTEKDETEFEVCKVVGDRVYRRHLCRACKRGTANRRRQALRAWLDDLKQTLRCSACGFEDYRALEFHHPDARQKDFNVADLVVDGRSVAVVQRELAKCVVLCANCHRITHYADPAEADDSGTEDAPARAATSAGPLRR